MLYFLLLSVFVAGSSAQLFLGPCPPVPAGVVKNVNFTKLAGKWYVAAKPLYYPVRGTNCSTVHYQLGHSKLEATFTELEPVTHTLQRSFGSITNSSNPGEYRLHFSTFPISLQYAVLAVDYNDYLVEYTCQSGALKYLVRVSVLTRKPLTDRRLLNSAVSKIPRLLPKYNYDQLEYVNHTSCRY